MNAQLDADVTNFGGIQKMDSKNTITESRWIWNTPWLTRWRHGLKINTIHGLNHPYCAESVGEGVSPRVFIASWSVARTSDVDAIVFQSGERQTNIIAIDNVGKLVAPMSLIKNQT